MISFLIPSLAATWIANVAACTSAEFLVKLKIRITRGQILMPSLLLTTSLLAAVKWVVLSPPDPKAHLLASLAQEYALAIGENFGEAFLSYLHVK